MMVGKESILNTLYSDIKNPSAFSGKNKLINATKNIIINGEKITENDVTNFLKTQRSHTLHGLVRKKYVKRPIMVSMPGHILGSDICDMTEELRKYNDGFRYLLILIDLFSRKLNVVTLKDKKNKTVADAIETFLERGTHHRYSFLFTDEGGEYFGRATKTLLKKYGIKQYHIFNRRFKNSIAERVIRSLKGWIYKIFTHFETLNYIKYINDIVNNYNRNPHRGLCGETPNDIDRMTDVVQIQKHERDQLKQKYLNYGSIYKKNYPKGLSCLRGLQEGTYVRIMRVGAEGFFSKSYKPIFSEEIFKIIKIDKQRSPYVFYLEDLGGEKIKGGAYAEEIIPTTLPTKWVINEVIEERIDKKSGKISYFVSFRGYPSKFNQWVDNLEKV